MEYRAAVIQRLQDRLVLEVAELTASIVIARITGRSAFRFETPG